MKLNRFYKRVKLFFAKMVSPDPRMPRPRRVSPSEESVMNLWSKVIHSKNSILTFDPVNSECYIEWFNGDENAWIFLCEGEFRIIRENFDFKLPVRSSVEKWCIWSFSREIHFRKKIIKESILQEDIRGIDSFSNHIF